MCIGVCVDMRAEMCTDMCIGMRADMCRNPVAFASFFFYVCVQFVRAVVQFVVKLANQVSIDLRIGKSI